MLAQKPPTMVIDPSRFKYPPSYIWWEPKYISVSYTDVWGYGYDRMELSEFDTNPVVCFTILTTKNVDCFGGVVDVYINSIDHKDPPILVLEGDSDVLGLEYNPAMVHTLIYKCLHHTKNK